MIEKIINKYKNHYPDSMITYRESAVMILLKKVQEVWHIVFEVRAFHLNSQPGDICLPGGKRDLNETHKDTAIRETVEELGIDESGIQYIGAMDYLENPYGIRIYPHIGILDNNVIMSPNSDEVDHIFYVPLDFFIQEKPKGYNIKVGPVNFKDFPFDKIRGGKNYPFRTGNNTKYFYEYKDYIIWGFTADIIKYFTDSLKDV
ncbi:NUDIX hydrolase [Vallitalea okinawensis]|uniref:NUDIX hydrolase n=1 Tax=Vallitalea okinawensis TaxID=2078660 RepID=UPI000CFC7BB6|nr:CoA pyrophosphatase [Vallitalea okinawensis]